MNKSTLKNILFIVGLAIFFFTPIGTFVKVHILRILSFSPSVEKAENQQLLSSYNGFIFNEKKELIAFEKFKNKIVIINFWATWCPPCIAEMPSLQKLYDDYKNKIDFVLITNDTPEKVHNFMQKNNFNMPIYYQDNGFPEQLYSKTIPATFLINSKGKIVIKEIGAADWNSEKVREILDKLLQER